VGAFCIAWPDAVNQVGLFEPVGTHPDFQRQGLGKAVMLETLRRLQRAGMRQAIVSTGADNTPAIHLYASAGFRIVNRLMTYKKLLAV
jgi:ribosomal protein S18 acetylase RimI-like enzyme